MKQREVWIDVAKGIGIIAVVFGHVFDNHVVFLWHMSLFFVLAGYNYHHGIDTWQYIWKLTKRLLLPYFACIIVGYLMGRYFDVFSYMRLNTNQILFGGVRLKGVYAVFWFVTVLYGMLICLHLLSKIGLRWWIVCLLLVVGYIPMFIRIELPWNLHVVPMALAYGCLGYLLKNTIDSSLRKIKWYWIVAGLLVLVTLSLISGLSMDMKYNDFGIPLVSFVLSLLCVMTVFVLAKGCEEVKPIGRILSWIGKGSMVIMYSHMLVNQMLLLPVENRWIRFILVLTFSSVVFFVVEGCAKFVKCFRRCF